MLTKPRFFVLVALVLVMAAARATEPPPAKPVAAGAPGSIDVLAEGFAANAGLASPTVRFQTRGAWGRLAVLDDGRLVHAFDHGEATDRVDLELRGVDSWRMPIGVTRLPNDVSIADAQGRLSPLPRYREVHVRSRDGNVRQRWIHRGDDSPELYLDFEPGSEPKSLRFAFTGATPVDVRADGTVELRTTSGTLDWAAPVAWQEGPDGQRRPVRAAWRIAANGLALALGPYNPQQRLVVDPFLARTYHGGNDTDGYSPPPMLRLRDGGWLVQVATASLDFPGMGIPPAGSTFGVVTRFNENLSARPVTLILPQWSTVFQSMHMAQNQANGDIYLAWHLRFSTGPLVVRRYNEALTTLLSLRDIAQPSAAWGEVLALAVSPGSGNVYVAQEVMVNAGFLSAYTSRIHRLPLDLSNVTSTFDGPMLARGGLVVERDSPHRVLLLQVHGEYGQWPPDPVSAPSFGPDQGFRVVRRSADLTNLVHHQDIAVQGTITARGIFHRGVGDEVIVYGSVNAPSLPPGAEPAARSTAVGRRDLFAMRLSALHGIRASTYAGTLGDDYLRSGAQIPEGLLLLGRSCSNEGPSAIPDRHVLTGNTNALLPLRPRPTADCDDFVVRLSGTLDRFEWASWLPQPLDTTIRATRDTIAAWPDAPGPVAVAGHVNFVAACGGNLGDTGFTLPGAVQAQAGGGCNDVFVETLTPDLAVPVTLPGLTCGNSLTTNCGAAIPNGSPFNNWLRSNRSGVVACNHVRALRVGLAVDHPWVGDLSAKLTGPDGTQVQLLDRPGRPSLSNDGCSNAHLRIVFDDAAPNEAENSCDATPPASHAILGEHRPSQALAGFIGKPGNGTWQLEVVDHANNGHAGTLVDWSLDLACSTTPIVDADLEASFVSLTAPGLGGAIVPGRPFTWRARIRNLGPATANGARLSSDLRGNFRDVSFTCTPVSGATCLTPSGANTLVEADVNLNVGGIAEIEITATPVGTLDSPLLSGSANTWFPASLMGSNRDPNPANDQTQWIAPMVREADLRVLPLGVPPATAPDRIVSFQFGVINDGPTRIPDATVRLLPIERLAIEQFSCTPGLDATTSAAAFIGPHHDVTATLSPTNEGFLVCTVAARISASALPGQSARVAFSIFGAGYTETMPGNNAHEHTIPISALPDGVFSNGFETTL